jgi:hypothetical protein
MHWSKKWKRWRANRRSGFAELLMALELMQGCCLPRPVLILQGNYFRAW